MTQVSPGSLDSFARYVDELADAWNSESGSAVQMAKSKETDYGYYPKFGGFSAATTVDSTYERQRQTMVTAAGQVYDALRGLAEGTRRIAEKYRTAHAASTANVAEVQKILSEEVQPQAPGQDPTNPTNPNNPSGAV